MTFCHFEWNLFMWTSLILPGVAMLTEWWWGRCIVLTSWGAGAPTGKAAGAEGDAAATLKGTASWVGKPCSSANSNCLWNMAATIAGSREKWKIVSLKENVS